MIKNALVFIVLIIFMSTLAGCVNSRDTDTNQSGVTEIEHPTDSKTSVEIPSYYPEDLFPIYENAYIESIEKNENGNPVAICYSNDSVDKVVNYYKDLILNSDAEIFSAKDNPDDFLVGGKLGNYKYTIAVTKAKIESGYKTYFNIGLVQIN